MNDDIAIKAENISKTFKLPHEKNTSIKGAVINFYKRNKSYEKQQALENISFEVKKGEFFGIVGRNGSGKSTLLKMLAGIYSPSEGYIQIKGKLTPFIELGVGFNQELSGRENVYLNGALLGFNRKDIDAMYDDIVDFAEIERFMDQKLKNYSSGMQVRLAFSIAIRARTDILLLDEVLAVGDAAFQQKCYNYFEELKKQKKTVVFVSHDMSAVRRFCSRAIYIKDGKLIKDASAFEVADLYLEENIEKMPKKQRINKQVINTQYSVGIQILEQTTDKVLLEVSYKTNGKEELYTGISVVRDGVSVAEINTVSHSPLVKSGSVVYSLDTRQLNAGIYYVATALFKLKNKQLVSIGENRAEFVIKGNRQESLTLGAALKLADTWQISTRSK